ncbi:TetR/AcrR family transcriptional regulator [Marinovum sp.]|uniref:TetR/AcrR family transcriptional regulator n=1 Tax=Marinovum sp. TaxID=2024839 RepID=UPI003A9320EC
METGKPATEKTEGWRGSRELWLNAASAAFVAGGEAAVKIQPLAQQLKLSRTSFYWFFKDRDALLAALLDHWEAVNTAAIERACAAYAESLTEGVLNLLFEFLDERAFDPRFDFAVRGWAIRSEAVNARVARADAARIAAIRGLFERFGLTGEGADVRAHAVYLVQIGYISMQITETLETRLKRVPHYVRTYTGEAPSEREMARFRARLGQG